MFDDKKSSGMDPISGRIMHPSCNRVSQISVPAIRTDLLCSKMFNHRFDPEINLKMYSSAKTNRFSLRAVHFRQQPQKPSNLFLFSSVLPIDASSPKVGDGKVFSKTILLTNGIITITGITG